MIAVSNVCWRSFGTLNRTSPALVCSLRSYLCALHSRSASASSKAFNVSSTVPRTTRSRWLLIRSSSIVMTLFSRLGVSSDMAAPSCWPGCVWPPPVQPDSGPPALPNCAKDSVRHRHARRQGGRADRGAFADHERRRRAAAFIPARLRPGVTLHPYSISSGSKEILKKSRQRLSVIVARYLFDPAPHFASITTPFLFLMVLES